MTTEQKAKAYDEAKYIMKEYLESGNAGVIAENTIKKAFPELKESEDERMLGKCLDAASGYYSPEDKQAMKDFLNSLKDRVQPKQEWNKDDEEMLSDIDSCIKNLPIFYETIKINGEEKTTKQFVYCARNWLKSLRTRSQWKPSEEQLKSLKEVIDVGHFTSYPNALEILYEQLKKLREE